MNKKQKACLLAGITAIVVMGLFPPWVIQSKEITRLGNRWDCKYTTEPGPYSFIGDPPVRIKTEPATASWINDPKLKIGSPQARARFIDLYRLGVQYFIVAVVTAGLVITFRDEKATKQ